MAEPAANRDASPLEAALERVGDRWSLLIVEALLDGPRRFNELGDAVAGIAPNILTDRLRRLERERILAAWGSRSSPAAEPTRHGRCGTPLETRWFCPTCEVVVDRPDADEARTL